MLRRDFAKTIPAVLGGAKLGRAATTWPRYKNPMTLNLRIPERHPYMVLTVDQLARARKRAAESPEARQIVDRIRADADGFLSGSWDALPPKGNPEHSAIGRRILTAAQAAAFSGEQRYAEWARNGLLAYAAIYPGLPFSRSQKLFTFQTLDEATWIVSMAQAYDLVADSGAFTPEQARRVEQDLLRASAVCFKIEDFQNDPRIKNMHHRCYNFQEWHFSAVGLAGLAARDPDLVDWAVNSPYGLRHMIAHDVRDDGMFWERSQSYHNFVIQSLVPLTEALLNCGVDVYNITVPADRTDDDINYNTDVTDRPKSLRMMFEAPFYMTFPDLTFPVMGDSSPGPLRADSPYLVGYARYRDPKIAWLIDRSRSQANASAVQARGRGGRDRADWRQLAFDPPSQTPAALPVKDGRFCNSGEYRNGCSLFPATGVAILRQASGDFTAQPESTAVALRFGPYGGGHNHADQLGIVLYAQGRQWIPTFPSVQYYGRENLKGKWTAQTISHNSLIVDGISQKPTGRRDAEWPVDKGTDRVFGVLERFDGRSKSASAYCDRAYDGVRLRRGVRLEGPWAIDVFSAADAKGAEHQYDLVLHIDGQFEACSATLEPRSGKLGEICGYQLVEQKRGGAANGPFDITFTADGKKLRLWVPAEGATEVIVGEGMTNTPDRRMAMLVLRRRAAETRFLTVFEPVAAANAIRAVRAEKGQVIIESAQGTRRTPQA